MRSIAAYVRSHHIGLLALFVALGGTAYAVENAPKDSVVSKSIKDGQVRPRDVKLTKTVEYPGTITLFDDFVEFDPVRVTVPDSGLLSVYMEAEISKTQGQAGFTCNVSLSTTGDTPYTPLISVNTDFNGYSIRRTAPATDGTGVFSSRDAAPVTYSLEPGNHQFSVAYSTFNNTGCGFRNTKLVIIPLP